MERLQFDKHFLDSIKATQRAAPFNIDGSSISGMQAASSRHCIPEIKTFWEVRAKRCRRSEQNVGQKEMDETFMKLQLVHLAFASDQCLVPSIIVLACLRAKSHVPYGALRKIGICTVSCAAGLNHSCRPFCYLHCANYFAIINIVQGLYLRNT